MNLLPILVSSTILGQVTTTQPPESSDLRSLFARLRHGVVRITAGPSGTSSGTGFLVDRECTIVTAAHVIQGYEDQAVAARYHVQANPDWMESRSVRMRVVSSSKRRDLAFLRPVRASDCHPKLSVLPIFEGSDWRQLTAEPVLIIGFPGVLAGDFPVARSGIIASADLSALMPRDSEAIFLDLTAVPGFSGSPVILQRTGEVIGLIRAVLNDPKPNAPPGTPPLPPTFFAGFSLAARLDRSDLTRAIRTAPEATVTTTPTRKR